MTNPVIITGGAQRLGLAMAESLNAKGYEVLVTYRTKRPSLAKLESQGVSTLHADFCNNEGVMQFIDSVKGQYSSIRAIIHNASDWDAETSDTAPHELFERMMQIHGSAPYQINMALSQHLVRHENPSDIIHMTDYVQDTGSKKHIAYAASKAALANLTLSFSSLLAPDVKVNAIAPALVMFNDDDSPEYKQKALNKSLLRVCPGAEEAVKAMHFLLDSDYVTGRTMHLDGGRHLA